jgi:hypothetical protein
MGTARRRWQSLVGAPLAVALTLLVAACGGSDSDEPTAEPTGEAGAVEIAAFRYELTIELSDGSSPFRFEQSGEVVLPDREHASQSYEVASLRQESERVAIGERAWVRGDLPWVDLGASPLGVLEKGGAAAAYLEGLAGSAEELGGDPTTRYELTAEQFVELAGAPSGELAPSTAVTIWVSDALGVPVQMTMSAEDEAGTLALTLRVTDLNASDIAVEEPAAAQASRTADRAAR